MGSGLNAFARMGILLLLASLSFPLQAQSWRVIELKWNNSPTKLGDGDLRLEIDVGKEQTAKPSRYSFTTFVLFEKPVRWAQVSSCSLVKNQDVNTGTAGISFLQDRKAAVIQLNQPTTSLVRPRVCILARF